MTPLVLFDIDLTLIATNGTGRAAIKGVHGADQAHHDIPRGSRPPTERYGEPVEKACYISVPRGDGVADVSCP